LAPRKGKESLFNFIGVEDELNNKLFGKIQEKSDRIQKRVQIFSQELSLSEREILQHGFVDCINCAVWGIDGGDFQKDTIEAGEIMLDLLSRKKKGRHMGLPLHFWSAPTITTRLST
jgi:ribulose kinase